MRLNKRANKLMASPPASGAMRTTSLVALVLALAVAGCAAPATEPTAPDDDARDSPSPRVVTQTLPLDCRFSCYEPTVAVAPDGTLYATDGNAVEIAVSTDGGANWSVVAVPSVPDGLPFTAFPADVIVDASPSGRLYYSALIFRAVPGVGGAILEGIQVAASDDRGATWAVDTYLMVADEPTANVYVPDRQWLGFGPDGAIYLTYNQIPSGIWFARSDDGGATWSGWTRAASLEGRQGVGQSGPPVVTADGTIVVPACVATGGLAVFASNDGGATFTRRDVAPDGCSWFPILAASAADGDVVVAAWQNGADVLVASSADAGATWTAPERWGAASPTSPWPLPAANGTLDVAWFQSGESGGGVMLRLARGTLDAGAAEDILVADGLAQAGTDFAHAARAPDGAIVLVWQDDGAVRFARVG